MFSLSDYLFWRIPSQARPSLWQPAQRGQDFRVVENVFFSVWQLEKLGLCLTLNAVSTESLKFLEACIVRKHIMIEEVSLRLRVGAAQWGAGCRQRYLLCAGTFAFNPRGIFLGQLLNAEWKEFAIEAQEQNVDDTADAQPSPTFCCFYPEMWLSRAFLSVGKHLR